MGILIEEEVTHILTKPIYDQRKHLYDRNRYIVPYHFTQSHIARYILIEADDQPIFNIALKCDYIIINFNGDSAVPREYNTMVPCLVPNPPAWMPRAECKAMYACTGFTHNPISALLHKYRAMLEEFGPIREPLPYLADIKKCHKLRRTETVRSEWCWNWKMEIYNQ